jgi:hypothetical protein
VGSIQPIKVEAHNVEVGEKLQDAGLENGPKGFVERRAEASRAGASITVVSAIKPYEGFGDVDHTIKELMSL